MTDTADDSNHIRCRLSCLLCQVSGLPMVKDIGCLSGGVESVDDEEVKRIVKRARDPNDIGKIKRTPGVMGGRPVIAGTRIAPEFVWSFHEGGFTTEQIIGQYTHLYPEDVEAAIRYEAKRRRKGAEEASLRSRISLSRCIDKCLD